MRLLGWIFVVLVVGPMLLSLGYGIPQPGGIILIVSGGIAVALLVAPVSKFIRSKRTEIVVALSGWLLLALITADLVPPGWDGAVYWFAVLIFAGGAIARLAYDRTAVQTFGKRAIRLAPVAFGVLAALGVAALLLRIFLAMPPDVAWHWWQFPALGLPPEDTMSMNADEQIVFFGNTHGPQRAGRKPYWRIERLNGLWDPDPYAP